MEQQIDVSLSLKSIFKIYAYVKTREWDIGPGQVAQLVRASSRSTKISGWTLGQGTNKKQQWRHKLVEQQIDVSLSLQSINKIKLKKEQVAI